VHIDTKLGLIFLVDIFVFGVVCTQEEDVEFNYICLWLSCLLRSASALFSIKFAFTPGLSVLPINLHLLIICSSFDIIDEDRNSLC
jgi:hypothetical protein